MNNEKVLMDGPAEGIATCKHCNLPIYWNFVSGKFGYWFHKDSNILGCESGRNSPQAEPVEPAAPVVIQVEAILDKWDKVFRDPAMNDSQPPPVVVPDDEVPTDNFWEASKFAGITFSQGCQFHLMLQHLLGKGPAPGFLKTEPAALPSDQKETRWIVEGSEDGNMWSIWSSATDKADACRIASLPQVDYMIRPKHSRVVRLDTTRTVAKGGTN